MIFMDKNKIQEMKKQINNDICKLIEAVFRVRDNKGQLNDYKLVEPHKKLIKSGLLGDKSILTRAVSKGRQEGFSNFIAVECLAIAQLMPNTHQYYIATKEGQAKDWLRDRVEKLAKDARLNFDGSRFIDLDSLKSSQLQKLLRHFPKSARKEIEYSYITGLSASPESVQGPMALNVVMDEMPLMCQRQNQQRDTYDAVTYFLSQGGQLTMQGVPQVKSDLFWKIYSEPQRFGATAFHFPIIENWRNINLRIPLYYLEYEKIPVKDRKWYVEKQNIKINEKKKEKVWMQDMKIPYFWWDIGILEQKRSGDLDYFKQWCLGIPYDVQFRFISPELLYPRVKSEERTYAERGKIYKVGIDVGQERDMSAITVGEVDADGKVWERFIEEMQDDYTIQGEKIYENICKRFKPIEVRIDNTGIGRGLADILSRKGVPVTRVEFASTIELEDKRMRMTEYLAMNFKESLIKNNYFLVDHPYALHHVLGIQRLETSSKQIRYSGKQGEAKRDDHFWSKCLLAADFGFKYSKPSFSATSFDERGKTTLPVSTGRVFGGVPIRGHDNVLTW